MYKFPLYGAPMAKLEKARDEAHSAYVTANGAFLLAREVGLDIERANKNISEDPEQLTSLELFNLLSTNKYPKLMGTVYTALGDSDPRNCSELDEFGKFILAFPDLLESADKVIIFGRNYFDDYDGTTIIVEHGEDRFEYDGILNESHQEKAKKEFEATEIYTKLKTFK